MLYFAFRFNLHIQRKNLYKFGGWVVEGRGLTRWIGSQEARNRILDGVIKIMTKIEMSSDGICK